MPARRKTTSTAKKTTVKPKPVEEKQEESPKIETGHVEEKEPKKQIKQRSQLNFNLSEDRLKQLKEIAEKKGAPVSILARMWLIERIEEELKKE